MIVEIDDRPIAGTANLQAGYVRRPDLNRPAIIVNGEPFLVGLISNITGARDYVERLVDCFRACQGVPRGELRRGILAELLIEKTNKH